ncbi:UNVERIFIED_CONTAM: Transposon Tf2-12 polyprotein [Sesamum radiatum]|uniref:Transposon Tf2-12 polyprotein n=1 Tax=Sesamum radiatum TaxID=300843 RepID=A0AAW2R100_SESRA
MAFRTPKGIYCYKVMPFGLKNAGATYQRAMQKIFDDMLHKNVECYVDDLVVKSKLRQDHLQDLKKIFERLRRYQLKMNPLKCAFGVTSGKFLGFIVPHRGIEIEQAKIDATLKMPEPRNIHELKSLQGKLAYVQRSIKSYLMKPPVLIAPVPGRPLILYIAAQECSGGALLAQENDEIKESALYYLSRRMTPNELKYSPIEKICLALIFSIQKLKHYFQAHIVRLISKANPLKYVMSKPVLSDRLTRWYLQLQQFKIVYVPQKAVKGQVLADFLADHPIPAEWELSNDLPDENILVIEVTPPWKMYFDGVSHKEGSGAGVIFITSDGEILLYSFTLTQNCSNNIAEYQTLILGLEMAVNINYAQRLIGWLGDVEIEHVPRKDNKHADALAKLASTLMTLEDNARVPICKSWVIPPIFDDDDCEEEEELHAIEVFDIEKEDWRQPLIDYLKYEKMPDDPCRKVDIRRRATCFIHHNDTLYRRSFDGIFLRCLSDDKATQAMEEAHSGPPEPLHPTVASWPFDAWGLDVVGPLAKSSVGHLCILAAIDYFSKWAEAVPLKEVKENIADFIRINIIYRYGIPRYIITDNGKPFCNSLIDKLTQKFNFKQRKSSMYNAAANGLAEAFDKTLCNLLKKVVAKSKKDWHERI